MPGLSISLEEGERPKRLKSRVEDLTPLLNRIGAYLVRVSSIAFVNQRMGSSIWPARSVPNIMGIVEDLAQGPEVKPSRFSARPALVDTGALRASVKYKVQGRASVNVGSTLPYARLQQEGGTSTIPVTPAVKRNLSTFLKAKPELRDSLAFLFRKGQVSAKVPARPFIGLAGNSNEIIRGLVAEYLGQTRKFDTSAAD